MKSSYKFNRAKINATKAEIGYAVRLRDIINMFFITKNNSKNGLSAMRKLYKEGNK